MAYQVGSACYSTMAAAAQAAASSEVGRFLNHDSSAYVVGVSGVSETTITYSLAPVGGGSSITMVSAFSAQPCNLLTFDDGVQIGWMMAAVWIGVYAVMFIARALRGETGGDYGNA